MKTMIIGKAATHIAATLIMAIFSVADVQAWNWGTRCTQDSNERLIIAFLGGCADYDAFAAAKNKGTTKALLQFIKNHPNSNYANEARELAYWIYAQVINTKPALEEYLSRYGDGQFSEDAKRMLQHILEAQKTVKVMTTQSYTDVPKGDRRERIPLFDISKYVLDAVGFRVVGNESKDYDILLIINSSGKALGTWYKTATEKPQFCYSGVLVSGQISVRLRGEKMDRVLQNFYGKMEPPSMLISRIVQGPYGFIFEGTACTDDPELAPYLAVISTQLGEKIVEAISKLDIDDALILLIRDYDRDYLQTIYETDDRDEKGERRALLGAIAKAEDVIVKKGESALPRLCRAIESVRKVEEVGNVNDVRHLASERLLAVLKKINGSGMCANN